MAHILRIKTSGGYQVRTYTPNVVLGMSVLMRLILGIFRDVHLLAFPSVARIEDFFVKTELDLDYVDATLRVDFRLDAEQPC